MTRVSVLLVSLLIAHGTLAYTYNRTTNPLVTNYSPVRYSNTAVNNNSSGLSHILPQNNYGLVATDNRATSLQTTTTTTQVQVPRTTVSTGHTHPTPSYAPQSTPRYAPPPTAAPMMGHTHGPQVALPPVPVPGTPHLHSGHPYIAPAVAPQRMTYQQIVEYLASTNGTSLNSVLGNGSGNFLAQCKAYCDILPPNPTCDSSNTLYRNECEAKCVHKTVSTSTLRYGMCCCSDDDFDYTNTANVYFSEPTGSNLCISTCIFNCLGQETPIDNEHSDDTVPIVIKRSDDSCANID